MGILSLASGNSVWRGYEYYKNGKVKNVASISDTVFTGKVSGDGNKVYDVRIDTVHPRKSECNCPHAKGKRIICKHQVALFFSAFPYEAERYYQEVIEYEEQEEKRQAEIEQKVIDYVCKLKKDELQQTLLELLFDGPEWQYERFIRQYIEL